MGAIGSWMVAHSAVGGMAPATWLGLGLGLRLGLGLGLGLGVRG